MNSYADNFLPGVPISLLVQELSKAAGNELEDGKFLSPESSAALAANTFGWFLEKSHGLPPFPGLEFVDWPAWQINVERQVRFPWRGGCHPWLDAAVETQEYLIGVESKRFEPFRDKKSADFSASYDRNVWGANMAPFERTRDKLKSGALVFEHLDATQLVKHAFGLVTEAQRIKKNPVLVYLYAEPNMRGSKPIPTKDIQTHRDEIFAFSQSVKGAEVRFASTSYRNWLDTWSGASQEHAKNIIEKYCP